MKSYSILCIMMFIMLITGCVAHQPIPEFRELPEELAPIYDQSLADLSAAAFGRNQCRTDCVLRYEGQTGKLKVCNDFCDCLHRDQELAPTWHQYIVCVNEILDRVIAE